MATHSDYTLVGPASFSEPAYPITPAKPGETILLFAFGFGLLFASRKAIAAGVSNWRIAVHGRVCWRNRAWFVSTQPGGSQWSANWR